MTEPEAGTKWRIRQAGSLTAEQRDREGLIRVPQLGQDREAAVYAPREPAEGAGPRAMPSPGSESIAPGALRPSRRGATGRIASRSWRAPVKADRRTEPGRLCVRHQRRCLHPALAPGCACSRGAGAGPC